MAGEILVELWRGSFAEFVEKHLYTHQRIAYEAGKNPETYRDRWILKPRQVGGSFGIALEMLGVLLIGLVISSNVAIWKVIVGLFIYGMGVGLATAQLTGVIL